MAQRDKKHHRADDGQCRALEAHAGRLEEHGENERGHKRQEAHADDAKAHTAYLDHELIGCEHPQQLLGNKLEAQCSDRHQCHAEHNGDGHCPAAAVYPLCGVVIAYQRHDAGLHCPQRDEEKCLPLVVKPQRRDRLVTEGREDEVKAEYVKGVRRLHEYIRHAEAENLLYVVRIQCPVRRGVIALFHHDQRCYYLPGNGCDRCTGDAHFRQAEQAEDEQRV